MVALTTLTGTVRIVQIIVSIISIGMNGKLTANTRSLMSLSNHLLYGNYESSVKLNSSVPTMSMQDVEASNGFGHGVGPYALSLATSSLTILSHTVLSGIAPRLLALGNKGLVSSPRQVSDLRSALAGTGEKSYAASVVTSEVSQFILWFSTFSYQTSKYASWNCNSVDSLLSQYNVTQNTTSVGLSSALGYNITDVLHSNTGYTNSSEINELIGTLFNLTSLNTGLSFSRWNETGTKKQQEFLIDLSQDCQLKKASIGMNCIGILLFFLSGGLVTNSAFQIYFASLAANREAGDIEITNPVEEKTQINENSMVYSIASTFAYLKPTSTDPDIKEETIKTDEKGKTTVETSTSLPNEITLTTTTELEKIQPRLVPVEKINTNDDLGTKKQPQLFKLNYSRAILLPSLVKSDSQVATKN